MELKETTNIIKKNPKISVQLFVWYLINSSNPQPGLWTSLDQFNFFYMIKNTKINILSTQYWIIKLKKTLNDGIIRRRKNPTKKNLTALSMSKELGAWSKGGLCVWLICFSFIKGWALFLSKKKTHLNNNNNMSVI
jgi:hypothetical protein